MVVDVGVPEGNTGVDISWVSLGVSLAVVPSTGDRLVGSVDARSRLEADDVVVDVGVVVDLAGGGGNKAGNEYLELIIRMMLP